MQISSTNGSSRRALGAWGVNAAPFPRLWTKKCPRTSMHKSAAGDITKGSGLALAVVARSNAERSSVRVLKVSKPCARVQLIVNLKRTNPHCRPSANAPKRTLRLTRGKYPCLYHVFRHYGGPAGRSRPAAEPTFALDPWPCQRRISAAFTPNQLQFDDDDLV